MRQGSQYIDECLRFNPVSINIDERNLVLYGLANGYICQLRKVNHIPRILNILFNISQKINFNF
jgi:hypothetical protein